MRVTPRIEQAVEKAATLHEGQYRKLRGEPPYITHLMIVAMLVAEQTNDEDTIIAALMHDAVEDASYSLADLANDFGDAVREIVAGVTEDNVHDDGSKKPWQHRKDDYLQKISSAPEGSILVSLADKIHNMRSVLDAYGQEGTSVWEQFSAGNEKQLWFHGEVLAVGRQRLGEEHELVHEFDRVYRQAHETFAGEA